MMTSVRCVVDAPQVLSTQSKSPTASQMAAGDNIAKALLPVLSKHRGLPSPYAGLGLSAGFGVSAEGLLDEFDVEVFEG